MKYSLRSLMVVVLVGPPLLAWVALPMCRWLMTPKPRSSLSIKKPYTVAPQQQGTYDPEVYPGVTIGYPSSARWEEIMAERRLPNSSAPTPKPPRNWPGPHLDQ